jgi:hypothetical protein
VGCMTCYFATSGYEFETTLTLERNWFMYITFRKDA